MKTNELIVKTMNTFDSDDHDALINLEGNNNNDNENNGNQGNAEESDGDKADTTQQNDHEDNNQSEQNHLEIDVGNTTVGMPESESDDERNDEEDHEQQTTESDSKEQTLPRRSERVAKGVSKPSRYAMAMKVLKDTISSKERRKAIEVAETVEILLLFSDLQALQPVYKEFTKGSKPLNCHMFTVEKYKATGEFDKMKSRLVANGNEQDPELYHDNSSPTVANHSILTSLLVAAVNISYKLAKIDVKGAFVQTRMRGPDVFIKCRPN